MTSTELHLVKMFSSISPQREGLISSSSSGNDRVQALRQLLLSQLDLIQKQSEVIVAKDHQIKELKKEIDKLNKKLNECEKSKSLKSKIKDIKIEERSIKTEDVEQEILITEMETDQEYYVMQSLSFSELEPDQKVCKTTEIFEEIPGWRVKPVAPSYVMEGTENIEDETLLKRHQKPETDEKRRKRWDVQRIREQRHVARLRARYEDSNADDIAPGPSSKASTSLQALACERNLEHFSLVPNPDDMEEIVVQEKLPVSAFGCVLPQLGPKEFTLPWM